MKEKTEIFAKLISVMVLLILYSFNSFSQKLPNMQSVSLSTPNSLKIDGNAIEWNNQFQAHNKGSDFYYTIANNDTTLYLIVQVLTPRTIEKILDVGVNFTINITGKKSDKAKGNMSVIYPVIAEKYTHGILVNAGDKANYYPSMTGRPQVLTRTDSSVALANKTLIKFANNVKIFGLKNIIDTLVSVYNKYQIHVAATFNLKGFFTYELEVPLKYLGLSTAKSPKFNYEIKLKDFGHGGESTTKDPGSRQQVEADPDLNSTSYFWGEYTLIKKP